MGRISIAKLLGLVAVVAVAVVAISRATPIWESLSFNLMVAFLFAGPLGVAYRRGRRAPWVGFVLFGWGYFLLGFVSDLGDEAKYLSEALSDTLYQLANTRPVEPATNPQAMPGSPPTPEEQVFQRALNDYVSYNRASNEIAHWMFVLAFGGLGAFLGGRFSRPIAPEAPAPTRPTTPDR
jgi:hypothetical protein